MKYLEPTYPCPCAISLPYRPASLLRTGIAVNLAPTPLEIDVPSTMDSQG